jgi:hypothetical protein
VYGTTGIFLSDKALMGILLSSVEVYKLECHGALLGTKTRDRIIVEYAIPFQAAERKFAEVIPNWRRELKVTEVLPKIVHLTKVGYFHSHPQFGKSKGLPELTPTDEKYLESGEIEIVVAINDSKKAALWTETKRGLCGTLGKYKISIAGFYKRKNDGKITKLRIVCPYATGFDLALCDK